MGFSLFDDKTRDRHDNARVMIGTQKQCEQSHRRTGVLRSRSQILILSTDHALTQLNLPRPRSSGLSTYLHEAFDSGPNCYYYAMRPPC